MLRDPDEAEVGQEVFLYPHSKTASRACWRQLSVTITKPPKKHWPMLVVEWHEPGGRHWELVHKDNIRLRRPTGKAEGDATQDHEAVFATPRKIGSAFKPVELPDGYEQETLF